MGFNFSAFHKFRCGDKFVHMVEDAYSKIQSKIKIKELLSDPFTFTWGVYQGCLLSMLLYILWLRYLPVSLMPIKGIHIGDHEIKIVYFADNIIIYLKDISCLNGIHLTLKLYEDASSSKVNLSKSQAVSIGWCI